jgi:hypothetical protein
MSGLKFSCSLRTTLFAINAVSAEIYVTEPVPGYSRTLGYFDGTIESSPEYHTYEEGTLEVTSNYNLSFTGYLPITQTFYGFDGWGINGAPEEPPCFPQTMSNASSITDASNEFDSTTILNTTSNPFGLVASDIGTGQYLVLVLHVIAVNPDGSRILDDNSIALGDFLGTSIAISVIGNEEITNVNAQYNTSYPLTDFVVSENGIVIGDSLNPGERSAYIGFGIPLIAGFDNAEIAINITGANV